MSLTLLTGGNIANVELVKVVTDEQTPRTLYFNTAMDANWKPALSNGTEKELRIKNSIQGLIKTDDILKGYDIDFSDQKLLFDILALVDGGTVTTSGTSPSVTRTYTAPAAGSAVNRIQFDISFYTSDRDDDGSALRYWEWKFTDCKGKPVSGSAKDDDFSTLKYEIASRPAIGVSPMTITELAALPSA